MSYVVANMEEIKLRDIDKEQAKKEVLQLIRQHSGILFSEIFDILRIDPELLLVCLNELEEEGIIESRDLS